MSGAADAAGRRLRCVPSGASVAARVLDFRRRGTPPRRRRRDPAARAAASPLAAALLVVALPSGAGRLGAHRAAASACATVAGGRAPRQRVGPTWVRRALRSPGGPEPGAALARRRRGAAPRATRGSPPVEIDKELPDRLARARSASASRWPCCSPAATLVYADRRRRARIAPVASPASWRRPPGRPAGGELRPRHPSGAAWPRALEVAGGAGAGAAGLGGASLTRIEVLGEEDFRLHTDALPFPVLVTEGQVGPESAAPPEELLPELARRYPKIDSGRSALLAPDRGATGGAPVPSARPDGRSPESTF